MSATREPFKNIFASVIRPVVSEDKDRMLALASMEELKPFIPNIDVNKNVDVLPIAFDACVVNRGNKNGDISDTDTALAIYKTFVHKFIDAEHNRQKIIGVILTASLTEYGTNKPLREEDVRGTNKPFYITLGGVLWKAVNDKLCDLVEDASDPTSSNYMKISASWELGFTDYAIVEFENGKKDMEFGRIITEPAEIKKLERYLKCFGGSGSKDGKTYYRMPNENVVAMGVGLTEKPAADVQGIITNLPVEDTEETTVNADDSEAMECTAHFTEKCSCGKTISSCRCMGAEKHTKIIEHGCKECKEKTNLISQPVVENVSNERKQDMKITSIADITDENLKQCNASVITTFIKDELKKANDTYVAQQSEQATAAQKSQALAEEMSKKLVEVQASLDTLVKEREARAKVDAFNARMSEMAAAYEFSDDIAKIVADDLKGITSDEAFASYKTKAETIFKPFSKVAIAAAKKAKADADEAEAKAKQEAEAKAKSEAEAKAKADEEAKKKGATASQTAVASVVENAVDNATQERGGLPNTSSASAPGLKEKFAQAFAEENFRIKI